MPVIAPPMVSGRGPSLTQPAFIVHCTHGSAYT